MLNKLYLLRKNIKLDYTNNNYKMVFQLSLDLGFNRVYYNYCLGQNMIFLMFSNFIN